MLEIMYDSGAVKAGTRMYNQMKNNNKKEVCFLFKLFEI
jgi:hypothetical protein